MRTSEPVGPPHVQFHRHSVLRDMHAPLYGDVTIALIVQLVVHPHVHSVRRPIRECNGGGVLERPFGCYKRGESLQETTKGLLPLFTGHITRPAGPSLVSEHPRKRKSTETTQSR